MPETENKAQSIKMPLEVHPLVEDAVYPDATVLLPFEENDMVAYVITE